MSAFNSTDPWILRSFTESLLNVSELAAMPEDEDSLLDTEPSGERRDRSSSIMLMLKEWLVAGLSPVVDEDCGLREPVESRSIRSPRGSLRSPLAPR